MRAGLFGGTFNPIHNGHLALADAVLNRFALDHLYFIPCRVPPHKSPPYLAPATDRAGMIRQALPKDPRYRLSEVELQRTGPSYTIDTVHHFKSEILPGAGLHLLMGLDAFMEMHTWKQFSHLLNLVSPIVVARRWTLSSKDKDEGGHGEDRFLDHYIRSRLCSDYAWDRSRHRWLTPGGACIHWLPVPLVDVSSSLVRRCIGNRTDIDGLVPAAVSAYIEQKDLYR
ncbi:MAG: nicotinate (nicotinamide) nucleotide adenylyltransferase [Proteobacteria bacterium]|nr:MAG: nicotinate (nicotinamide) nucleotide adenylyltransferase [Pseudomonadota bacterium]PIE66673.1 MAG: nicotinate (nicotinamide) nucleotide adenylyltransferase [Deltaproteobacteria bacterium]